MNERLADFVSASVDLSLLEQRVRITASDGRLLRDLSRCFELEVGRGDGADVPGADLEVLVHREPDNRYRNGWRWRLTTVPAAALPWDHLPWPNGALFLTSLLNQWAIDASNRYYVFHAGSVVRGERAILLPGGARSGKSTLTAALLRRGFDFLSDEVGAIDVVSETVASYPRVLSLRHDTFRTLELPDDLGWSPTGEEHMVAVEALGAVRATAGASLGLIVAPCFEEGSRNRLELLRPGPAVLTLMGNSCSQQTFKEKGLDFVIGLVRRVPCYRLTFSDLDLALEQIEELFSRLYRGYS